MRYFLSVGGALLVLLFVVAALLPQPPANNAVVSNAEPPTIRIRSERKGPEAVVLDTSRPAIVPEVTTRAEDAGTATSATPPGVALRESFAQFVPSQPKQAGRRESKKAGPKLSRKQKVAAARAKYPQMFAGQYPYFGRFDATW